jgi:hypothetical protein
MSKDKIFGLADGLGARRLGDLELGRVKRSEPGFGGSFGLDTEGLSRRIACWQRSSRLEGAPQGDPRTKKRPHCSCVFRDPATGVCVVKVSLEREREKRLRGEQLTRPTLTNNKKCGAGLSLKDQLRPQRTAIPLNKQGIGSIVLGNYTAATVLYKILSTVALRAPKGSRLTRITHCEWCSEPYRRGSRER